MTDKLKFVGYLIFWVIVLWVAFFIMFAPEIGEHDTVEWKGLQVTNQDK